MSDDGCAAIEHAHDVGFAEGRRVEREEADRKAAGNPEDLAFLRQISGRQQLDPPETLTMCLPSGIRRVEDMTREELIEMVWFLAGEKKAAEDRTRQVLRMERFFNETAKARTRNEG